MHRKMAYIIHCSRILILSRERNVFDAVSKIASLAKPILSNKITEHKHTWTVRIELSIQAISDTRPSPCSKIELPSVLHHTNFKLCIITYGSEIIAHLLSSELDAITPMSKIQSILNPINHSFHGLPVLLCSKEGSLPIL